MSTPAAELLEPLAAMLGLGPGAAHELHPALMERLGTDATAQGWAAIIAAAIEELREQIEDHFSKEDGRDLGDRLTGVVRGLASAGMAAVQALAWELELAGYERDEDGTAPSVERQRQMALDEAYARVAERIVGA